MRDRIRHNKELERFELLVDGFLAHIDYRVQDRFMVMYHTYVPPFLEGSGIASLLVGYAIEYAVDYGFMIKAECPFVKSFISKREDLKDHVLM